MRFDHTFRVDLPVEAAWDVLLDLERVAACMPGAELQGVDGDEYLGSVSVRLGMLTAGYAGRARLVEADPAERRIVVKATGTEAHGPGRASATVSASLREQDHGTRVDVTTDLSVGGRVAQLGRGMLANVSSKLLEEFVDNLQGELRDGEHPSRGQVPPRQPDPVNLLALHPRHNPDGRRVGSLAVGIAVAVLVVRRFHRRRPVIGALRRGRRDSPHRARS